MLINVFTNGLVAQGDQGRLDSITEGLNVRNYSRTGRWHHLSHYDVIDRDTTHHVYSYADRPLYAAACIHEGKTEWIVLSPNHPSKQQRCFFTDKRGGAQ